MKIIAVEANYTTRVDELRKNMPNLSQFPFYYQMPDSAILHNDKNQFFIPDFTQNIHFQVHFVVKISKMGKNIIERFSHRYYDDVSVGINFIAHDVENKLMLENLPCDIARGFDNSVAIGKLIEKQEFVLDNIDIQLNGNLKMSFLISDMIKSVDQIVEETSKYFTLKTGDILFTGTPTDFGKVKIGDKIQVLFNNQELLAVEVC